MPVTLSAVLLTLPLASSYQFQLINKHQAWLQLLERGHPRVCATMEQWQGPLCWGNISSVVQKFTFQTPMMRTWNKCRWPWWAGAPGIILAAFSESVLCLPGEGLGLAVMFCCKMTLHQAKDLINPVIRKSNLLILGIRFLSPISFLFPYPPPSPWLKAPSLQDTEGNANLFFPPSIFLKMHPTRPSSTTYLSTCLTSVFENISTVTYMLWNRLKSLLTLGPKDVSLQHAIDDCKIDSCRDQLIQVCYVFPVVLN